MVELLSLLLRGFVLNPSKPICLASESESEGGQICKERSGKGVAVVVRALEVENMMRMRQRPPSELIGKGKREKRKRKSR